MNDVFRMSSRSKHLVSLALNKALKEKMASLSCKTKNKEKNEKLDPDFVLQNEQLNESSDSDTGDYLDIDHEESIEPVETSYDVVGNVLSDLLDSVMNITEIQNKQRFTKKGLLRKRKLIDTPPLERKKIKQMQKIEDFKVKDPCSGKCKYKCTQSISAERQNDINSQFWQLSEEARRIFIFSLIKKEDKKRHTAGTSSSRKFTFKYYLKTENSIQVQTCKKFFLATLGYDIKNDRILKNVRNTNSSRISPKPDNRGRQACPQKIDRQPIIDHVNMFNPTLSHYRREHAPNKKYLPSDVTIQLMWSDFKNKNQDIHVSYELYRKVVSDDLNISFTKLGHEECWQCELFEIHKKSSHTEEICEQCQKWNEHHKKYLAARKEYKMDSERDDGIFFSADLEKVFFSFCFFSISFNILVFHFAGYYDPSHRHV